MTANPLFNSVSSHRSNRPNHCLQNVNDNRTLLSHNRRDPTTRLVADGKRPCRRSDMADDKDQGPPGKRRRVEAGAGDGLDDDFWDDSDFDFTQEQLENIDSMVSMSQIGQTSLNKVKEASQNVGRRSVGRGMPRSASTGDVKTAKPKGVKSLTLNKDRSGGVHNFEYPGKIGETRSAVDVSDQSAVSSYRSAISSSGIGSMSGTNICSFPSLNTGQHQMKAPSNAPVPKSALARSKALTSSVSTSSVSQAGPRNPVLAVNNGQSPDLLSAVQKETESLKKTLEEYKHKLKEMQDLQYGKDGQIKMLRQSLTERENEVSNVKRDRLAQIEQDQRQQTEKEKNMEKEMERLRTQLQFKEHEIVELQGTCRKLEAKSRSSSSSTNSEGHTSPRRAGHSSPRRPVVQSPQVTRSPRVGDAPQTPKSSFPNRQTFMSEEGSPTKPASVTRSLSHTLSSETSSAQKKGVTQSAVPLMSEKKLKTRPARTVLNVTNCRGHISGSSLMAKLVQPVDLAASSAVMAAGRSSSPQKTPAPQGLVNLLQVPPAHMNTDSLKLQRSTAGFSPLRPKRATASSSSSSVGSSSTTISSLTSSPDSCIVSSRNYQLATEAVTHLLHRQHSKDGSFAVEHFLPSDTESAILMLPVIEDYLQAYLNLIHSSIETYSMSQGGSLQSVESSVDSLTSSVKNLMADGSSYANHLELCALNSLKLLNILVNYSNHVRIALVSDKASYEPGTVRHTSENTKTEKNNNHAPQASTSVATAGPSSSDTVILEPTHSSCGKTVTPSSGYLDITITRVLRDSQLLDRVIKAANPLLPNNQLANQCIIETSLQILASVAQGCSEQHVGRFRAIFSQEVVVNCLMDVSLPTQSCCSLHISVVDVLISLARFPLLLELVCNHSDECPMLFLYHVASASHKRETDATRTALTAKVVHFVSILFAHHKTAGSVILESDCHCSVDVVKCLVQMLNRELHVFQRSSSNLSVLRQGVALLQTISKRGRLHSRHLQEAERAYVELICGLHRIFRRHGHITEYENGAIDELWNFDQDCPDSDHDQEHDHENMDDDDDDEPRHAEAMDTEDKS